MKTEILKILEGQLTFYKKLIKDYDGSLKVGKEGHRIEPKLSAKKAYQIIYILQDGMRIIPDTYEQCWSCKELFDTYCSGLYWETKGRHYCDACSYQVPYNYDRGKK